MKRTILAVSVAAAVVVTSGYANAQTYEQYFGGQEGVNKHLQGSIHDDRKRMDHLQGSINDDRKRITANEQGIAENTARSVNNEQHLDRVEGVLNAHNIGLADHQRRLNENDARNQRQDDIIDNAHARIGGVIEQSDKDRAVINGNTERSLGNQQAIGDIQRHNGAQDGRIERNTAQIGVVDSRSQRTAETVAGVQDSLQSAHNNINATNGRVDNLSGRVDADRSGSIARDNAATVDRSRIEGESIKRDDELVGRITDTDQSSRARDAVQDAYARDTRQMHADISNWSAEQWNRQTSVDSEQNARLADAESDISGLKDKTRQLESGIAGVAALNAVFDPNYDGLQSHVGTAVYGSGSAIGVSLGGRVSRNNFIHAGVSLPNRGSSVFSAGISTKW